MNWIYAMVRFICQLHGLEVCRLLMAVQTWDSSSPPLSFSALALCQCLGVSEHRGHILFTFLLCCHGMTTPSSVLTERANTSAPLCLTSSEFLTRN